MKIAVDGETPNFPQKSGTSLICLLVSVYDYWIWLIHCQCKSFGPNKNLQRAKSRGSSKFPREVVLPGQRYAVRRGTMSYQDPKSDGFSMTWRCCSWYHLIMSYLIKLYLINLHIPMLCFSEQDLEIVWNSCWYFVVPLGAFECKHVLEITGSDGLWFDFASSQVVGDLDESEMIDGIRKANAWNGWNWCHQKISVWCAALSIRWCIYFYV